MDPKVLYDHADSQANRQATPAKPAPVTASATNSAPKLSEAAVAKIVYDAPSTTVGKPAEPSHDPSAQAQRERLSKLYTSDEAKAGRALAALAEGEAAAAPPEAAKAPPDTATAKAGEFNLDEFTKVAKDFDPTHPMAGEYAALVTESKIDTGTAAKLFGMGQRAVTEALAAQQEAQAKVAASWRSELEADTEIQAHANDAREVVRRFGDAKLVDFLNTSGAGDNPQLARFLVRVAQALKGRR